SGYRERDRSEKFNLSEDVLMRVRVYRTGAEEYDFIWSSHHILMDGWCMGIIVKEFWAIYNSIRSKTEINLPRVQPYSTFIKWLENLNHNESKNYWRVYLSNYENLASPPKTTINPQEFVTKETKKTLELSKEQTQSLHKISKTYGVTLNTIIQSIWGIQLSKYNGINDVVFGAVVSGRSPEIEGIESMVGLCVNTIPVRISFSEEESFDTLVRKVHERAIESERHHHSPLAEIQASTGSGVELLDHIIGFQNYPIEKQIEMLAHDKGIDQIKVSQVNVFEQVNYDLSIVIVPGDEIRIIFDYNPNLYGSTIENITHHLTNIINQIVLNHHICISELNILSEDEKGNLESKFNNTDADYPKDLPLIDLFEEQVIKTPDNVAIIIDGHKLTYLELDHFANAVAHKISGKSEQPNTRVGLLFTPSFEMVASILGVLKAGCSYVPISPKNPGERNNYILKDCGANLLLTGEELVNEVEFAKVICIRYQEYQQIINPSKLVRDVSGEDAIYVIYTSGSTGQPKGVEVKNRGVVNYSLWRKEKYKLSSSDVTLNLFPYHFDGFGCNFFPSILSGASLILIPEEHSLDTQYISNAIRMNQVTNSLMTPGFYDLLLPELKNWDQPSLRFIALGAEKAPATLLEKSLKIFPGLTITNEYGPTETSMASIQNDKLNASTTSIVGKPISNTRIYILGQDQRIQPIGVPGELHIAGDGLSAGYVNNQELTSERFVDSPFEKGKKIYKTGDSARWLPDGTIEFLGRLDDQVKISGYRVELGEIESTLCSHEKVRSCVLKYDYNVEKEPKLLAYIVPDMDLRKKEKEEDDFQAIGQWETMFDDVYTDSQNLILDSKFNIAGWNSSYSGEPIPEREMKEWVDNTVEEILSRKVENVLEIGCGTGLMLFNIAPHCKSYVGTDISKNAIDYILKNVSKEIISKTELFHCEARDLSKVSEKCFDTIILNSVIQYFPNISYLENVLSSIIQLLEPGGRIFLGDIRSLPLLEMYHSSVELYKSKSLLSTGELKKRIARSVERENELLINPAFFSALKENLESVSNVKIIPHKGVSDNELTKFRYNVVIHNRELLPVRRLKWLDWFTDKLDLKSLGKWLQENRPKYIGISHIPNSRLHYEKAVLQAIEHDKEPMTVGDLVGRAEADNSVKIDIDDIYDLAKSLNYYVDINWGKPGKYGEFDTIWVDKVQVSNYGKISEEVDWTRQVDTNLRSNKMANNPMQWQFNNELVPELRSFVMKKLPEYMIPKSFVCIESFPLTPNGKLDKQSLLKMETNSGTDYVEPSNEIEERLVIIWSKVLKVKKEVLSVNRNFFELGGHSLKATYLRNKISQSFQIDIPLMEIFRKPTIKELSDHIIVVGQFEIGSNHTGNVDEMII
ncbi:MAG: amino acid adenylation domain-containing protein, partial [Balneolaceae bacterium]